MNGQSLSTRYIYIMGAAVFTYILMVMGTFVTSTGSGLACPDWPLCYGSVKPPLRLDIWFEWGHRLLGAVTGILILGSTYMVWRHHRGVPRFLTGLVLFLLLLGVLIGGVIVVTEAPYLNSFVKIAVVSSHLVIATLVLTCLIFTLRFVYTSHMGVVARKRYYAVLFGAVYLQVILGIIVRYSGSTLACPDFPLCNGEVVPAFTDYPVVLHFMHRVLAVVVLILGGAMLYRAFREGGDMKGFLITFMLLVLQAVFGVLIVVTEMFLPVIIMHAATGFFLLAWLAYHAMPDLFGAVLRMGQEAG